MRRVPTVGLRLGSMLLDHLFTCFILMAPMIPVIIYFNETDGENNVAGASPAFQLAFIGVLVLYFFKDSFNGRSLAKRVTKLQVVDYKTGMPATIGQCFVRNLFIIVWPVEVLVTLFRPQRRTGDLVAGTKVAFYDPHPVPEEESGLLSDLV